MLERYFTRYIILFSIVFSVGVLIYFPKWTVDDAYITFRYSENLANNFQLTYNVNSDHVEGYTGFLLPVLISFAIKAGIPPVTATHSIGIISLAISIFFLFLILRQMKIAPAVRAFILFIFVTLPILYTHVYSGLETISFLGAILISIYLFLKVLQDKSFKNSNFTLLSLSLLMLSLIRPEGQVLSILIVFTGTIYFLSYKKKQFKKIIIFIISIFIIPFLVYFVWRWDYYGQFFPNTYYLKTGSFKFYPESYNSFLSMLKENFAYPFIAALFFMVVDVDKMIDDTKKNKNEILSIEFIFVLLPVIIFTLIMLVQYFHTDLLMDFSHRFFITTTPLLFILLSVFMNMGYVNLKSISKVKPKTVRVYFLICIIFILFYLDTSIPGFQREVSNATRMKILLDDVHIPTGKYIYDHFDRNLTLLVHADAGAIPYFAKLKTIDFGGLNDNFLSHKAKLSEEQINDYFFSVDADILAITSFRKNKLERMKGSLNWKSLKITLNDTRFKNYRLVKVFDSSIWSYYEYLFVKKDLLKQLVNQTK